MNEKINNNYLSPKDMVPNQIFNLQVSNLIGYSRYLIHEDGIIHDLKRNKLIKADGKGYRRFWMWDDFGKKKMAHVHHVVARCFIGEIPDGWDVNHIDEDKGNNARWNLEIVTHKQNCNHGTRCLRISQSTTGVKKIKREFEVVIHDDGEKVVCKGLSELCRRFPSQSKNTWNYRIANVPNFMQNWYEYKDKTFGKISVRCTGEIRKDVA